MRAARIFTGTIVALTLALTPSLAFATSADGSLNTSFTTNINPVIGSGQTSIGFTRLAQRADGKYIALAANGPSDVFAFNADGTGATKITIGSGFDDSVNTIAGDAQNRVLVGGSFSGYNGTNIRSITRISTNGQIDSSFVISGWTPSAATQQIAVLPTGKILVAAQNLTDTSSNVLGPLIRINSNGSLDTSFVGAVPAGLSAGYFPTMFSVQPNGKIFVGVTDGQGAVYLYKLNSDGSVDTAFTTVTCAGNGNPQIASMGVRADGGLVLGGDFVSCASHTSNGIIGITATGAFDPTFNTGTGITYSVHGSAVTGIAVQGDGRIVATGIFPGYNGTNIQSIMRLLPNGSLDPAFDPGHAFHYGTNPEQPRVLALVGTSGILIAGLVSEYNLQPTGGLLLLHTSVTPSALPNTGSNGLGVLFASIALLLGGMAIVAGSRKARTRNVRE